MDKRSSYENLLDKAQLPRQLNRRLQHICILMYKVKKCTVPKKPVRDLLKPQS